MKKSIFVCFAIGLLLVGCKSNEQKAQDLANEAIKKSLYIPDSYDPVSFELDSAFAPYDDPEYRGLILEMMKTGISVQEVQQEMSDAESDMAIWGNGIYSAFSELQYREAKEKYDNAQEKYQNIANKINDQKEKYLKIRNQKPTFIGFKGVQVFRAKNNAGNVLMGKNEIFFDKELSKVIGMLDMEEEDYEMFVEGEKMFADKIN